MNQAEFLLILRESLERNIPRAELEENIAYYKDYFESSDSSETEVCEQLGDPRLIAKSIVDAYLASKGSEADHYTEKARSEYSRHGSHDRGDGHASAMEQLLHTILLGVGGLFIIFILLLVLRIALIIVIPIALVILIWKLIRGN